MNRRRSLVSAGRRLEGFGDSHQDRAVGDDLTPVLDGPTADRAGSEGLPGRGIFAAVQPLLWSGVRRQPEGVQTTSKNDTALGKSI